MAGTAPTRKPARTVAWQATPTAVGRALHTESPDPALGRKRRTSYALKELPWGQAPVQHQHRDNGHGYDYNRARGVQQQVIAGDQDSGQHHDRIEQAYQPQHSVAPEQHERDAKNQRPLEVQAGHGRVRVVADLRLLQLVVQDGRQRVLDVVVVRQVQVRAHQPRGHHGEHEVDDQGQAGGDEEHVAHEAEVVAPEEIEPDQKDRRADEVAVQVKVIDERDDSAPVDGQGAAVPLGVPEDDGLHPPLVEDVPALLDADHGQPMPQGNILLVRDNTAPRLVRLAQ